MLLLEESADLNTPTGVMRTHVFRPTGDGRHPALILYSEIFQLTGPIRRMAALFAGHGYVVAVPEVYHELEAPGTVLPYDRPGTDRGNAHKLAKPIEGWDADQDAVLAFLAGHASVRGVADGKVGALGVCLGGHLAFRAATHPGIAAAACIYPTDLHKRSLGSRGDDSLLRASRIKGELLMVFGRQDPHIPLEGRALVRSALEEAQVNHSWLEVNGQHAFMRDEGPRYDPELTRTVTGMCLDLFRRTLS